MARCWTCGKLTSEPVWKCSTCRTENAIQTLQKDLALNTDKLAKVEQHGFEVISDELYELNRTHQANTETLSDGFSNLAGILQDGFEDVSNRLQEINTTLEWGFGEISWKLQQQTEILQSIDHTLKTPTQTKANEWRQMAEESRNRSVLDDAEKIFLRSLDAIEGSPLDYRSYIGLARTYIQMNEFDKARTYLEESLPHAPDNSYKNYSYRMIGHVDECVGDYHSAVSALKLAIEFSPNSYVAHYDLARCSAKLKLKDTCLSALKTAIYGNSIYFYLAESADFEPLSVEAKELLREIKSNTLNTAKSELAVLTKIHKDFIDRVANEDIYVETVDEIEPNLDLSTDKISTGDYKAFLDALFINRENYKLVDKAKSDIEKTIKTRNKAWESISKAEKMLSSAEESMTGTKETLRRCINASEFFDIDYKNIETAKSKLRLAKDRASHKDYKAFLDTIEVSKEVYDLAYNAKSSLDSKHEHYKNTRSKRATSTFFLVVFGATVLGLFLSPIGALVLGQFWDNYHNHSFFKALLSGGATLVILFMIVGIVKGIVDAVKEFNTYEDMKKK
jgi:tetratricopeptide (TPR) repeat protein